MMKDQNGKNIQYFYKAVIRPLLTSQMYCVILLQHTGPLAPRLLLSSLGLCSSCSFSLPCFAPDGQIVLVIQVSAKCHPL